MTASSKHNKKEKGIRKWAIDKPSILSTVCKLGAL